MSKQIIFDCADDEYRVTLHNDDSVEVLHADGFIDQFDFACDFYQAYGLIESAAIKMMINHYNSLHVIKDYETSPKQQKQALKDALIRKIKSAALDAHYTQTDKIKLNNSIQLNIYYVIPAGMTHEEAKRIIGLKSMRKLVPCFMNNELLVDITESMKK